MNNTIDMQLMRYINLLERTARVSTTRCFLYNNTIIFAVPKHLVSKAIGKDAVNVKHIRETIGKKVKVIEERGFEEIGKFIGDIVEPVEFNKVEVQNGEVIVSAGKQNKAALIGRERAREQELADILKQFYPIRGLKIV